MALVAPREAPAKNWVLTINNPEVPGGTLGLAPAEFADAIQYLVYQLERAPSTGTLHFQGYVQFKKKVRRTFIKRYWPTAHLEVQRSPTAEKAAAYCVKGPTHVDGPWTLGTFVGGQGCRTDLHNLGASVMGGKKLREIASDQPEAVICYSRGLQVLEQIASRAAAESETRDPYVFVLWGASGTGKTSLAHSFFDEPDVYTFHLVTGGHQWFDGYDGQPALIIDDFTGWVPYRTLLCWLDRYPCRIEVKGGFTYARWRYVFITSNHPPESWYCEQDLEPLSRRVSYVWHFPEDIDIARLVVSGLIESLRLPPP